MQAGTEVKRRAAARLGTWRGLMAAATGILVAALLATPAKAGFYQPRSFPVGEWPNHVAIGDVGGDHRPDIVAANGDDDTVSVLVRRPGRGYAEHAFPVGPEPTSIAIGDLNGKGGPEIVTANHDGNSVSVLVRRPGKGYVERRLRAGDSPTSVTIGNVNGDRRPEIVTSNVGDDTVSVLAPGRGYASHTFRVGAWPDPVVIGHLNDDRKPDIVTANLNDDTVSALVRKAGQGYVRHSFRAGQNLQSVALGDLNGDRRPEIVTANSDPFRPRETPSFVTTRVLKPGPDVKRIFAIEGSRPSVNSLPNSVAVRNLVGDRRGEIITANAADSISVLARKPGEGYVERAFPVDNGGEGLAIGDLNGDGRADVATTDPFPGVVRVLVRRRAG